MNKIKNHNDYFIKFVKFLIIFWNVITRRLSCIIAYPILLLLDLYITLTSDITWSEQRNLTHKVLKKAWDNKS